MRFCRVYYGSELIEMALSTGRCCKINDESNKQCSFISSVYEWYMQGDDIVKSPVCTKHYNLDRAAGRVTETGRLVV